MFIYVFIQSTYSDYVIVQDKITREKVPQLTIMGVG